MSSFFWYKQFHQFIGGISGRKRRVHRLLSLSSFTADEKAKFQLKPAQFNLLKENTPNLGKQREKN